MKLKTQFSVPHKNFACFEVPGLSFFTGAELSADYSNVLQNKKFLIPSDDAGGNEHAIPLNSSRAPLSNESGPTVVAGIVKGVVPDGSL